MNNPKYKLGDVVTASSKAYGNAEGKIVKIEMSTGSVAGYIYKIGSPYGNYYLEDEITRVIDCVDATPNEFYEYMVDLKVRMLKNIYEILLANGKKTYRKSDNSIEYAANFSKKRKISVVVDGETLHIGKVYTRVLVGNEPQYMGHIIAKFEDGTKTFVSELKGQEFNVYSGVYGKYFG